MCGEKTCRNAQKKLPEGSFLTVFFLPLKGYAEEIGLSAAKFLAKEPRDEGTPFVHRRFFENVFHVKRTVFLFV